MSSETEQQKLVLTAKTRRNNEVESISFVSLRLRGYLLSIVCAVAGFCWMPTFGEAWPTYHGGADLTGGASAVLPDALERLWIYNTTGSIDQPPVSDGTLIFAAPGRGRVVALDLNGSNVWKKTFTRTNDAGAETPLRFDAPLLVHGGLVFAGSSRGMLFALDDATGEERWTLDLDGILLGSPNVIDDDRIVVLDQGAGALHCIDIHSGKVIWTTDGVERCDGSPGVAKGRLFSAAAWPRCMFMMRQTGRICAISRWAMRDRLPVASPCPARRRFSERGTVG